MAPFVHCGTGFAGLVSLWYTDLCALLRVLNLITLTFLGDGVCSLEVNLPKLSMEQRNALRKGFQHRYGSFLLGQSRFGADNDGLSNDRLLHFWATEVFFHPTNF